MVVNVFRTSTTVDLNHFTDGSQIQTYDFVREPHKKFFHKSIDTFCFVALTMSVTQNIRGVTEIHCLSKGILSQQRIRHQALYTEHIFRYEVGIISSYSKRNCYRKTAYSRKKDAWELHAALRTVFENYCSISKTTPAS